MRILVVEDEHKIANSIKQGLEQESLAVDVAYEGKTGFDLASSEEYDAIIMDRLLPEMEGLEITKKLRESGIHTPILMLTARGQLKDKVEGLELGADDYLTKPFAFEELLARLRAILRRPKKQIGNILKVSDLELDTTRFIVRRGEKRIPVSNKEFSLLEYLMRHPNRTISKQQIISHVWNYDSDILPNTVEVYIAYLRNKIDRPFKERPALINTVRGFGYEIGERSV